MSDETSAEQHRAKASEARARVEESWKRSDTDGFLSQWAGGLTAQLHDRKAAIAEDGGRAEFRVLIDLETGELKPSRSVDTKYGARQVTLDESGRFETFMGFGDRAVKNKGYRWATVLHPATAVMDGRGTGLSGSAWVATKPICGVGECDAILQAIGYACSRCGHVTAWEVVDAD